MQDIIYVAPPLLFPWPAVAPTIILKSPLAATKQRYARLRSTEAENALLAPQ